MKQDLNAALYEERHVLLAKIRQDEDVEACQARLKAIDVILDKSEDRQLDLSPLYEMVRKQELLIKRMAIGMAWFKGGCKGWPPQIVGMKRPTTLRRALRKSRKT